MLIIDDSVESAYFFKKSCTEIQEKKEAIILFASINNLAENDTFVHGYKIALFRIIEKFSIFKYAVLEEVADNGTIISDLTLRTRPEFVNPTAYFFYNYVFHPVHSKKTFIFC
jgi:hypothetical protein